MVLFHPFQYDVWECDSELSPECSSLLCFGTAFYLLKETFVDSEFSTYAKNEFTREDQKRLATFLLHHCPAKWMMIIKNTDFIYQLYNKEGINIRTFDKEYLVSFMNRNDKKVTHLLITNY